MPTKKKPKPRARKPRKHTSKKSTPPTINITIQVVAKKKRDNSKQALRMYDEYVAKRQGTKFEPCEMK